jgi:putative peptidoglycan lipid II flippase
LKAAASVQPPPQTATTRSRRLTGRLIGGALMGKILGFVREIAMAHALGISFVADGFRSSITAVLLPLLPLQGDTVPAVLIPLHMRWREQGVAAERFACLSVMILLMASMIMAAVLVFENVWLHLLVGGFTPAAFALTRRFVMIMALSMPASAVFGCLCSVELSLGRSRLTSMRASIQNIGVMSGLAIMTVTGQAIAIPWCFMLTFNGIAIWGAATLWREGYLAPSGIRPTAMWAVFCEFAQRLRPLLVQPFADIAQTWLERLLSSDAGAGTVASVDYARTLTESALFLVSQPVGYAVLVKGDAPAADNEKRMDAIARPILALALPASIFLMVAAPDVVRLVFARGAFAAEAILKTSLALQGISAGLWAATLGWILIRMLNAAGRNGAAAWVVVAAYASNALVDISLVGRFGPLALGLGEAARGIMLLIGTAAALRCLPRLLRIIMIAAPICLILAATEIILHDRVQLPLVRLGTEAAACMIAIVLQAFILVPEFMRGLVRRVADRMLEMMRLLERVRHR